MPYPISRYRALALAVSILLSLWGSSCNLGTEAGRTYMTINKDPAWSKFTSLEIAWKDPLTGGGAVLFHGAPTSLSPTNKFPADGYNGRKIDIVIKGFNDDKLAYQENRGYDGAHPATVTKVIVPIVPVIPIIPTSKLTTESIRNPADAFKVGDEVPAVVIEVEAASRKLTLSVDDFFKNKEDAEWKDYLADHKPNLATLGDVMPKIEGEEYIGPGISPGPMYS